MKTLNVCDFSQFPGPRYIKLGPDSGELFRKKKLLPALLENDEVSVNLDGVAGYGSSFLEEAFGGLVREGVDIKKIKFLMDNITSEDDPSIKTEIIEYISDELKNNE